VQHQVCILAQQVRAVDPQSDTLASAVAVSLGLIPTIFHDAVSVSSSADTTDYHGWIIEFPGLGDLGSLGNRQPRIRNFGHRNERPETKNAPSIDSAFA
jgi:hypothetical protein